MADFMRGFFYGILICIGLLSILMAEARAEQVEGEVWQIQTF